MSERIDHAAWARAFMLDAESPFDPNVEGQPDREATVAENLAFAQVHATLALVEQQRIANLIAVWSMSKEDKVPLVRSSGMTYSEGQAAAFAIREGLGLA
jgi:hypothetical protein